MRRLMDLSNDRSSKDQETMSSELQECIDYFLVYASSTEPPNVTNMITDHVLHSANINEGTLSFTIREHEVAIGSLRRPASSSTGIWLMTCRAVKVRKLLQTRKTRNQWVLNEIF